MNIRTNAKPRSTLFPQTPVEDDGGDDHIYSLDSLDPVHANGSGGNVHEDEHDYDFEETFALEPAEALSNGTGERHWRRPRSVAQNETT